MRHGQTLPHDGHDDTMGTMTTGNSCSRASRPRRFHLVPISVRLVMTRLLGGAWPRISPTDLATDDTENTEGFTVATSSCLWWSSRKSVNRVRASRADAAARWARRHDWHDDNREFMLSSVAASTLSPGSHYREARDDETARGLRAHRAIVVIAWKRDWGSCVTGRRCRTMFTTGTMNTAG
jgi:hypothetical protein